MYSIRPSAALVLVCSARAQIERNSSITMGAGRAELGDRQKMLKNDGGVLRENSPIYKEPMGGAKVSSMPSLASASG